MNRHPLLLAVVLGLLVPQVGLSKGKVEKRTYDFKEAGKEMEYALYVPKKYKKNTKTPLLVLLHGLGSNPQQVIRYRGITEEAEKRGYIVVAPYGYNERGWYGSHGKGKGFGASSKDPKNLGELSEKDVLNVLGIVRKEFTIDENRIYLAGHSMGGGGTMHLGATHPKIWAALGPLAPAVSGSRSILEKMKDTPIMVVAGDNDRLIPIRMVRRWIERMKELKMTHVYKEIEGGDHVNSFVRNPEMIAELFDFFDKNRRNGTPTGSRKKQAE